jgi:hypothetical protein
MRATDSPRLRTPAFAKTLRAFDEDMEFTIGTWLAATERAARADIIDLAAAGKLVVPIAATHPLSAAADVLNFLSRRHPGGGKHALVP